MKRFIAKGAQRARQNSARRLLSFCLFLMALAFSAGTALAQGCQMCYESAKGAPKDGQLALSRAILVLLLPPLCAMTLGVGAAFRYGKLRDLQNDKRSE